MTNDQVAIRSGDSVRVVDWHDDWGGSNGEVFKVDHDDPDQMYKVMLDCGLPAWFARDELTKV